MKLEPFLQSRIKYSEQALNLLAKIEALDQAALEQWANEYIFTIGSMDIVDFITHSSPRRALKK